MPLLGLHRTHHNEVGSTRILEVVPALRTGRQGLMMQKLHAFHGSYCCTFDCAVFTCQHFDNAVCLLQMDPSRSEVFRGLGGAYQSQGQHQMAFASYQQAINVAPTDLLAYLKLGMLYEELVRHRAQKLVWPGSDTSSWLRACAT